MVMPRFRSKSKKRVATRTPMGRRSVRFKKGRTRAITCRLCEKQLGGVKNVRASAKSERVPSRMFAGELCGSCVARLVSLKARIGQGAVAPADASLALQKYLRMMK